MAVPQFSGDLLISIGKALRHLRKDEKMRVAAKSIGISQTALSRIENGKYDGLHVTLLGEIAAHYNVPLSELFNAIEAPTRI